jgi:hypothetical protein
LSAPLRPPDPLGIALRALVREVLHLTS